MDDIEKTRVEYVARLEEQLSHMQRQLAEAKQLADKWTPIIGGEIVTSDSSVRITLAFGGKRTTATLAANIFAEHSVSDLTYSIANTLAESLLVDRIREVIQPEVERLMVGAQSLSKVGKW